MKQLIILLVLLGLSAQNCFSQKQFTRYDNLPGIDKNVKPAYNESFSGWKRMLYQDPVNFFAIEKAFETYQLESGIKKSPFIRYYKIWKRAVAPYVNTMGVINLPDTDGIEKSLLQAQVRSNLKTKSAAEESPGWTFLGPKETFWRNEDGISSNNLDESGKPKQCPWQVNVYSFDVSESDENILYCGTETGFVNKTSNKGLTWEQVGLNYPFGGGITAVAIHPENPDIVYVSGGNQVHKTIDGGLSWTPLLLDEGFNASRLKISPDDMNMLVAATGKGLFISKDAGQSWNKKWTKNVWDIDFKPGDDSIIYALSKSDLGRFSLIISTNRGESFQTDPNFPSNYPEASGGLLATSLANPDIIYTTLLSKQAEDGIPYILKGVNTNNILEWELTKTGELQSVGGLGGFTNGQGYFDLVLEVSTTDENTVFWGTCSLWKSTDGAKNFTRTGGYGGNYPIHPDIQDMKIMPNGDTWVATDGGMNLSTDYFSSQENYSSRTKGIIGSDMWGFDQGWNEDIIVGGRYHNGNTAIADFYNDKSLRMGGAESPTGWVIKGKSRHVAFNDLGNGWILPKTAEEKAEGRFIFSKYPNMDEYGGRRSNLLHHPYYYETLYLGEGNGFWISNDIGESFELLYQFSNKVRYLQISHKNPEVLYADVANEGLYRSSDGGKTWEQKPNLTNGQHGDSSWNGRLFFVISPYDENRIYACLSNGTWSTDLGKVFKSTNGGNSWTDWTSGTNEITKCLSIQPTSSGKDLVYLFSSSKNGKNASVFSRYEDQPYWISYDTNYPAGMDVNIALPFYRDAKLRVAGNAGVWEVTMADTTFAPIVCPWVEKKNYECMLDTLYFNDHSILNHKEASWNWKITPEPEYISDANIRNPKVVLGNPVTYDVTLEVTQNGSTYSKSISEMFSASTCPSVNDCNNPAETDKSLWSLIYVNSEETTGENGGATNAFDGNPDSFWHTEWYSNTPEQPHEIQIDLGEDYLLSQMNYLPRQNSTNGRIKGFELYISSDKTSWGDPVVSDEFGEGAGLKKISFNKTSGRYVKLKSLSEQNGNPWATVAELDFIGCIEDNITGINPYKISDLKAYPIPTADKLTVSLPKTSDSNVWQYHIYSASGNMVRFDRFTSAQYNHSFDVSGIKPGVYFMILKNIGASEYRIKFVVR